MQGRSLPIMLVSGVVVLAAFCSFAAVHAETIVNFEEVSVVTDGKIMGEWSATITQAEPMNKVSMKTPLLEDISANDLIIRVAAKLNGASLPPFEKPACEAMKDQMIGMQVIAAGNPFPDHCPIAKNAYEFNDFVLNTDQFPPVAANGKLEGVLEMVIPGKPPLATISYKGTVSQKALGMG